MEVKVVGSDNVIYSATVVLQLYWGRSVCCYGIRYQYATHNLDGFAVSHYETYEILDGR